MFRFSSLFVLDLRSIALFRITLGGILLFDLMSRIPYIGLFLSDEGALSRSDLIEVVNRPWAFSVYLMFGDTFQVTVLMLLNVVFSLLLMLGLWTRVASIVCWVMLLSLQHRNPYVLNGGDTLLSVYAFWMMFLPLNARWSLDRLFAKTDAREVFADNRYLAMPGIAILLQTVLVYVFTVILKSGDFWQSGNVVQYVLRNEELIRPLAVWLQGFDSWHVLLSRLTFHWEWFGCVLLLFPFANNITRSIAVVGFITMHAMFGLTLDLAVFAPVSIMGWLILIPGGWWDGLARLRLSSRLGGFVGNAGRWLGERFAGNGGRLIRPGIFSAIVTGVAIVMVGVWNVRGLPDSHVKAWIPKPLENAMYMVKLRQKWGMFAPNPSQYSTWYALEAQLVTGDSIDLFAPKTPFSLRRPDVFTDRLPDRRWGKFMSNLKKSRNARLRDDYIGYLVNNWNDSVGPSSKIEKASLLMIRERIGEDGNYYDRKISNLREVHVDGVAQIIVNDSDSEIVPDNTDTEEDL